MRSILVEPIHPRPVRVEHNHLLTLLITRDGVQTTEHHWLSPEEFKKLQQQVSC